MNGGPLVHRGIRVGLPRRGTAVGRRRFAVVIAVIVAAVALLAGGCSRFRSPESPGSTPGGVDPVGSAGPTAQADVSPPSEADRVLEHLSLAPGTWTAWARMDRRTGAITGSTNLIETNLTESMVKVWIAADDLSELAKRGIGPDDAELATLSTMIRDSDDKAAQRLYLRNGGDPVIRRLISTCGLTDSSLRPGWWSWTAMSPRDAVRMGACVASGRVAGPKWTAWLLNEMRNVRGEGRFGIVSALPAGTAAQLAIKNGWTLHPPEARWNVNCLAVAGGWILAVEVRYPTRAGGLAYGAGICADTARYTVGPVATGPTSRG